MTDTLTPEEQPSEIVGGEGHGLLKTPDGRSIPFKAHPLADLFPMMSADEMKALVEDVRDRGVQRPIVLLDGMVLDGRNRYHAARDAGVGYACVDFVGDDPVGFVISENMRRRHLTDSQRQLIGAKLAKLPAHRPANPANGRTSATTAQTADMLNTSVRGIERARVIVDEGAPALVAAVASGDISISAAAEVAKLPEAEQVEIVAQGPAAVKDAAKAARQSKPDSVVKPKAPALPANALTYEALAEENEALKDDLKQAKAKLEKVTSERDKLKALVKDLSSDEKGEVIRRLTKERDGLRTEVFATEEKAASWSRQTYALKKRVEELEQTPIEMGV